MLMNERVWSISDSYKGVSEESDDFSNMGNVVLGTYVSLKKDQ